MEAPLAAAVANDDVVLVVRLLVVAQSALDVVLLDLPLSVVGLLGQSAEAGRVLIMGRRRCA